MWQPWYSLETFKFVFIVFGKYQGRHPDSLSFSVYGGLIIYILTLAAIKCLQNALFDMSFFKMNQNPDTYDFTENGQYICNLYVVWWLQHINKYIYFQIVCFIAFTELATVTTHFVAISVLISMVDFSLDIVA